MEQLNTFVLRTLDSGVQPIQTTYQPVYDMYCDKAVAFVQTATVNSIVYGSLVNSDLAQALADSNLATQYFLRTLSHALGATEVMRAAGCDAEWTSVYCPVSVLDNPDIVNVLANLIKDKRVARAICILFPQSLSAVVDAHRKTLSEVKSLGFRIGLCGFGNADFPVTSLSLFPFDVVFADGLLSLYQTSGNAHAVATLADFAMDLGADVVLTGIADDETLRKMRSCDCFGVLFDGAYSGNTPVATNGLTPQQLVSFTGEVA